MRYGQEGEGQTSTVKITIGMMRGMPIGIGEEIETGIGVMIGTDIETKILTALGIMIRSGKESMNMSTNLIELEITSLTVIENERTVKESILKNVNKIGRGIKM